MRGVRGRALTVGLGPLLFLTPSCSNGAPSDDGADGGGGTSNGGSFGGQSTGGALGGGGASSGGPNQGAGTGATAGSSAGGSTAGSSTGGAMAGSSTSGGTNVGGNAAGGSSAGGASSGGQAATSGTAGAGASSGTGGGTSMPCPSGGWPPGDQRITLMHGGLSRVYEVHIPPGYTGTTRVPLVMTIHGAHNTIALARGWSQMNPVADANGFIVVYPQGVDCWNTGGILPGCTAADDDVGFLTSVVADIQSHACIDPKRVYATGISNGAMMAQTLGCREADVFAAVGGVAGPTGSCNPSRPISVVYMHGTEDRTVGYSSARPNVTGWATRNGCGGTPVETYNMGSTRCETYQGCRDAVEVVFCTVTGMGHCWPEDTRCGPGGGPDFGVTDFEASPFMWEFFERHPLP